MSVAARKPPPTDIEPTSGPESIWGDGDIPREAPRAPTAEAWAAMTPAERDEDEAALLASESQEDSRLTSSR